MNKHLIVLGALLDGYEVIIEEKTYKLFKPKEEIKFIAGYSGTLEKYWLGSKMINNDGETFWVASDLLFSELLNRTSKLEEDYITILCAKNSINSFNKRNNIW